MSARDGGWDVAESGPALAPHPSRPFTVLAVCTGNICRSPVAEIWLRHALGPEDVSGVRTASAGVRAVVGSGVCPDMARFAEWTATPVEGFRARQLTEPMVRQADLVLALSRGHRAVIVEVTPTALHKTFTLREFARLAAGVGADDVARALGGPREAAAASPRQRLAALVPLASASRGQTVLDPREDDVVDPIGQPPAVAEEAADRIWTAVQAIARAARGRTQAAHRA